ncbi:MAG: aconitate hydratase, partial [Chloroflexi bacterium]|nr:aconitate hydratase [Chloroflexota bacterium]
MEHQAADEFGARARLSTRAGEVLLYRLDKVGANISRLPFTIRILLENLLRRLDNFTVYPEDIRSLATWGPAQTSERVVAFLPGRVLMQDLTGIPAVVDLAAMRAAVATLGGDPARINPQAPTDLVIDHSVQIDRFG